MKTNLNSNYLIFQPHFDIEKTKLATFLKSYESLDIGKDKIYGRHKYMIEIQKIANREIKTIEILTEDLESFFTKEGKEEDILLYNSILQNTKRYISLFSDVIEEIMPNPTKQIISEDNQEIDDIVNRQRLANINITNAASGNDSINAQRKTTPIFKNELPKDLRRKYNVIIVRGPGSKNITTPLRELQADQIGSLVNIKGIVVRTTDVKPFIRVACYICDICGSETYQNVYSRIFTPLTDCQSPQCRNNRSHGKITMINRTSKFVSFQELKIQEPSSEVPTGRVPRSIKILCFGDTCRQCSPGDLIQIEGVYLPSMTSDSRYYRSRLVHDTYIEAFKIIKEKKSYKDTQMTGDMMDKLKKNSSTIYNDLAKSIAPEIYGMDDIKKALLLLLVGGVDKEMNDGMKIRGNLNILLMGDPGIAKSQLLKYIAHISPRGVYTTGKGSSGVGLTAAVIKDPVTNDMVLEGGALVLADMGVCCIDEFDKMSDYDRANIHEVMEQQTVSIAKAGITTRLNARTSVLAAANPLYGRYNTRLSPHENINLPAALLSRFDLIFLLLDKPENERDIELAKHVAYVHQYNKAMEIKNETLYDENFIRSYIAQAKTTNPIIPKELHNFIVQKYVEKRKEEKESNKQGYQYITPRSLLAVVRLAQALAKLQMNDRVLQKDIDEALRLVEVSQSSINNTDENINNIGNFEKSRKPDFKSQIYQIIVDLCKKNKDNTADMNSIKKKIRQKGFKDSQLDITLDEYVKLNILYVDNDKTDVTLL